MTAIRTRRSLLLGFAIWLFILGSGWFARSHWGLEPLNNHFQYSDHPFSIEIANRSNAPVVFEAWDEDGDLAKRMLIDHQRDRLDLSAPEGTEIRVRVRSLTLQDPEIVRHDIEWTGEALHECLITVGEDGVPTRRDEASFKAGEHRGLLSVRSKHELPIKVGYELGPGHGGIYMPRARDRDKATWIGDGFCFSGIGGIGVPDGATVDVPYWIPAVTAETEFRFLVPESAAMQVEVSGDGTVSCGPRTWGQRALAGLGF